MKPGRRYKRRVVVTDWTSEFLSFEPDFLRYFWGMTDEERQGFIAQSKAGAQKLADMIDDQILQELLNERP